jgi:uncharacterized protein (DUF1330 family)
MKAYLVLDLAINDFAGFSGYIAAIPAHIAKHDGQYIVQALSLPALRATGSHSVW